MCVAVTKGNSGDGWDLRSTLLSYDFRKEGGFICSELGKCVTSEEGKYVFRADNVWCMCSQYFYCPLWLDAYRQYNYVSLWCMLVLCLL